ncbi:Helicase ARIP4 [Clonorchis sinensis]|uniref:Helicase ARIP4 n=1 Tax=Clonorchis sinensis TaxID=79923 RepID=A0A8T1M8R8_CLOSI|nr:Helicase ARIP4 [Clonorchis sinensis]
MVMAENTCEDGNCLDIVKSSHLVPNGQFRFEDGELVLSDNEPNLEGKGESEDASNSRKSRRKQTFERRNIKKVREDALSEEAKAAQKAEMERRKRLGKDHIDHTKFSNIEFLLNDGLASADSCVPVEVGENNVPLLSREVEADETSAKRLKTAAPECLTQMDGSLDSRLSEVVIKPEDETCRMNVTDDCTVEELVGAEESSTDVSNTKPCDSTHRSASLSSSASANLFGSWRAGQSRDDAILLGDSDDEQEKHMASDVIELSDGEEEPEEPEVETEICELQDAANLMDERGRVVLNPNRDSETECEICLPPQIARVIKPHQVSGIRFLYDNVIENQQRFETTDGFGCILAHSMGLGKTIQIIGFLDTIFRYCNVKRVLVIVPINTIQNWQAEFELWLPTDKLKQSRLWSKVTSDSVAVTTADTNTVMSSGEVTEESTYDQHTFSELFSEHRGQVDGTTEKLMEQSFGSTETMPPCKSEEFEKQNDIEQRGNLRSFKLFVVRDVVKTMTQRHQIVNQWFEEGGVLLLGYEMFRLLLNQKRGVTKAEIRAFSRRKKKTICLDLIEEERREKMLADFHAALIDPGPQLVICDEGHRIKNSEASISKALKAIKTRRRVVLTGYPLQNNLMEYWCMVDFVRPSYLGTKQEFTNMFQRPIENGQCIDSTPEDRKVMQGRAHVLHDLLSGFVQRRSHVVLKASLPPKTEIVLLIKLSPLQRTLYAAFMKSLNSSGPLGWAQVNTLKTYAMCCKIWNHPDILWRAMEEHKEAMDFDIEDPSSNSASSTAYSNRSLTRSATTSALSRRSSSQLSLSSSEQSTAAEKSPAETPPASSTLNWPPYATVQRSPNTAFTPPNPFFPTLPHSLPNRLTSPPSVPAYLYNQTQQNAPTVPPPGTYDWASDADLWGPDYKPGNVEHSGKIILFLSLLEGCVLAGDKILVFTQSLYTLDLLERILRRLPLPVQKLSEAATSSACDGQPDAPVSKFECTEDCDTDAKMYAASECRSIKATVTGPDESSESANSVSLPETDHPMEPVSTKNRDICEEQANSLDDSQFLESVLGHSGPVVSDEPTPSGVSEATEHQQTTQREPLSMTFEQVKEEEQPEETLRSLHYRLASRLGRSNKPSVWTKNVHYFRLDGSTTASEREKLINNFNDPKNPAKLFLVSTRAGCLGVNLIGANRVVVFDASWNPCHDCQAVCRVYRYGQVKPCYIYRLVSDNTMEKKIYDRQVTKQGMSDRVVDELNPSQQFTRSQVELLMSFEDKDMQGISQEDLQNCSDLVEPDPVLSSVLQKHRSWITKTPFTHESLLIDRKDYRLTRVEKRLARQRYEQEKRLSLSYQKAHLFQFQQMQALQHQQLLAAGINPAQLNQSNLFSRTPNILSRGSGFNYRPTYTSGMAAIDAMRQVERQSHTNTDQLQMPSAWASNCKVTRIVATTDLYFPSTVENKTVERKIPKGEVMEVIQTSKGKYLRIVRTGDLFVVKTSSQTPGDADSKADPAAATSSFGNGASASTTPASVSSFATPTCDSRQAALSPPRNSQPELHSQNTDSKTPVEPANPEGVTITSPTSVSCSSADARLRALFSEAGNRSTVCPPTTVNAVHDGSSGDLTKRLPAFSATEPPQTSVSTTPSSIRLHHPTNTSSAYPSIHHMDHAPSTTSSSTSVAHQQPHSESTQNQFPLSSQSTQASKHFEARSRVDAYQHQFDQQYFGQLAHRQQHQQTSSWICPNCRLPATSCTCNSPSGIANDSDKSATRVSAQHPLSPTSFGQQSSCSSFALSSGTNQPASPKQERKEPHNNAFVGSTNYGSVATSQFYSPEAVSRRQQQQQQQQQEYLRAAEEVARQSAAAYLHFNKQQLSSSQGNQHSSITPHQSRSDFNITSSAAHQQSSPVSGNNTNSPVFPSIPPAPNPASMVHDYFAQLTGQPGHQSSLFHPNTPAGNSHPVAAAMQQYLVSNAGGSSLVHSDGSNFYANLSSQRQFESATQSNNYAQGSGATEQQQNRSSMVGQHPQQQQQPYQFPLMQSSSQMPPFDRLQSHRLLPNFRLP